MRSRPAWWVLCEKALADAAGLLFCSALLLFGFGWLYTWLISVFDLTAAVGFFDTLPPIFRRLSSIPIAKFTDPAVMLSVFFVHPVVLTTNAIWAIARGSDCVSGEIDRGTMEILLAQPIPRLLLPLCQGAVMVLGSAVLAAAAFSGVAAGVHTVSFDSTPQIGHYVPIAVNLWLLTVCLSGLSLFVSAWNSSRGRTIGILGAFYVLQMILKLAATMWPAGAWVGCLTILNAYEPQQMVVAPDTSWSMLATNGTTLLAVAGVSFGLALVIFRRRDIPAPL